VKNHGVTASLYNSVASTGSATAMLLCNLAKVHSSVIDKKTSVFSLKKFNALFHIAKKHGGG
jgi:hypothetical protein